MGSGSSANFECKAASSVKRARMSKNANQVITGKKKRRALGA